MPTARVWGKFQPVTDKDRRRIIALLKKDPEEVPMRMIARQLSVGYSTVRNVNKEEKIRLRTTK